MRRNVELKASDPSPARTLELCRGLGVEDVGWIEQRDTYFAVASGRLKLREERPGEAHLIHYERGDRGEERESRYRIVAVAQPEETRALLAAALGERLVVRKRRHLLLWRTVRIHLDEVDGLGAFVELEAVAPPDSDLEHEHELIAHLRKRLAISDERLVARGYADLLEECAG